MLSLVAFTALLPFITSASTIPLEARQTCQDQSCLIAALAGSSPTPISSFGSQNVTGYTDAGFCCVINYNAAAAPYLYSERPGLQQLCQQTKQNATCAPSSSNLTYIQETVAKTPCAKNTWIFAKGTLEPFEYGVTIGPLLQAQLALAGFATIGVKYANDNDGLDCLGRPGAVLMKGLMEGMVAKCPNTQLIVSGYSQGAMVAHNALSSANAATRAATKVVVTFGDPFNGSPITGFNNPIKTYCANGDEVCDGVANVSLAHLSYGLDSTNAAAYIEQAVA